MFTTPLALTAFAEHVEYSEGIANLRRERNSLDKSVDQNQIIRAAKLFKQASRSRGEVVPYAIYNRAYCLYRLGRKGAAQDLVRKLKGTPRLSHEIWESIHPQQLPEKSSRAAAIGNRLRKAAELQVLSAPGGSASATDNDCGEETRSMVCAYEGSSASAEGNPLSPGRKIADIITHKGNRKFVEVRWHFG